MHVGGHAALRVASSNAAAPISATEIGFSEAGSEDEGVNEGGDEGEDEGGVDEDATEGNGEGEGRGDEGGDERGDEGRESCGVISSLDTGVSGSGLVSGGVGGAGKVIWPWAQSILGFERVSQEYPNTAETEGSSLVTKYSTE